MIDWCLIHFAKSFHSHLFRTGLEEGVEAGRTCQVEHPVEAGMGMNFRHWSYWNVVDLQQGKTLEDDEAVVIVAVD